MDLKVVSERLECTQAEWQFSPKVGRMIASVAQSAKLSKPLRASSFGLSTEPPDLIPRLVS